MACRHKLKSYLKLERLDFEPTTLIVVTFNPSWPEGNNAEWFYGRTHDEHGNQNNNFWDVLPRLYGEPSLINSNHIGWKQFCHNKQIAITDIIQSIDDADNQIPAHVTIMGGYSDEDIENNFYDFELTNLVRLVRTHPTITNVYVTRSLKPLITPSGFAFREQAKYNRLSPNTQLNLPDLLR